MLFVELERADAPPGRIRGSWRSEVRERAEWLARGSRRHCCCYELRWSRGSRDRAPSRWPGRACHGGAADSGRLVDLQAARFSEHPRVGATLTAVVYYDNCKLNIAAVAGSGVGPV